MWKMVYVYDNLLIIVSMSFDSALTSLFMAIMELPPAERKSPSGSFYFQYESRMGPKVTVAMAKKEEANHLLSMVKDK